MINTDSKLKENDFFISWRAIFIGSIVGLGLSFLFNLFNIAIGLSMVNTNAKGIVTLAVVGFVSILIGTIGSMFIAGFVSGYLGRTYSRNQTIGVLYGFTTWTLALVFSALLATNLGRYTVTYPTLNNPSSVVFTTDENMPSFSTTQSNDQPTLMVHAQKASNTIGMWMLLMFALFFSGALSSCYGAYCAMSERRK